MAEGGPAAELPLGTVTWLFTTSQGEEEEVELNLNGCRHRRRINTEGKAEVVSAVWGTELFQFLTALDVLFCIGKF